MTNHSPVESLSVVTYNSTPVLTTELLAQLYGTESIRIQQNHKRNAGRFTAGKHFFKVTGEELKTLRLSFSESQNPVSPKTRALILWTERGAARHAKMLETDQAWEVFEQLEDFYFSQKEKSGQVRKTRQCTTTQLTPLRQTAERLITTGLGKIYPDIWKLVHQRFDVEHIHQLHPEQIGEAIEFLNVLEGEYLGKHKTDTTSSYHFPVETADPHNRKFGNDWISAQVILDERNRAPELELLDALEKDGNDITGAKIRIHAMYGIVKQFINMQSELSNMKKYLSAIDDIVKYQTSERGMNVCFTGQSKELVIGGYTKRCLPR